jgi:MarR family transcriptional regulator, organic hydroperoxide resistance regulator
VTGQTRDEQLDADLRRAVADLIGRTIALVEDLAQRHGVPAFFIKALHNLERPMAMKDLGKGMHCDPSFVTVVADMLEKRGLARREAHPADRRVKNLVLTTEGLALKHRIESEMAARMPWGRALSTAEREQLLALVRKMLSADSTATAAESPAGGTAAAAAPRAEGEVDDSVSAASARVG